VWCHKESKVNKWITNHCCKKPIHVPIKCDERKRVVGKASYNIFGDEVGVQMPTEEGD
jgi:hypothetical protein